MKKVFSLFLCFVLVLSLFPAAFAEASAPVQGEVAARESAPVSEKAKLRLEAPAARKLTGDEPTSGACGEHLTWTYADGVLTITGYGEMWSWGEPSEVPWNCYKDSAASIVLPEGLTSIGSYAFYGFQYVSAVEIPDGVTYIGAWAFYGCSMIGSLFIPASVRTVGMSAFQGCEDVSELTVSEGVVNIETWAFDGCKPADIVIPSTVESLGSGVFGQWPWEEFNSVTISSSVKELGSNAISVKAKAVYVDDLDWFIATPGLPRGDIYVNGVLQTEITVPEGTKTLRARAFENCRSLEKVNLPEGLLNIEAHAFECCPNLETVTLPTTVRKIGEHAFSTTTGTDTQSYLRLIFTGDAPVSVDRYAFGILETYDSGGHFMYFNNTIVLAEYPADNETWSAFSFDKNYGAEDLTWIGYIGESTLYWISFVDSYLDPSTNVHRDVTYSMPKGHGVDVTLWDVFWGHPPAGHDFVGWTTDPEGEEVEYTLGSTYGKDEDLFLYPIFIPETYPVIYDANGGEGAPDAQTKTYGVDLVLSETAPTREGYDFLGWSDRADSEYPVYSYSPGRIYQRNEALTLYAVWRLRTFPVAYDANGGESAPEGQTKSYGVDLTLSSEVPERADTRGRFTVALNGNGIGANSNDLYAAFSSSYRFLGWNTAPSGGGTGYEPGASYTENAAVTLYAQWETTTETDSVELPALSRDGYDFLGWASDSAAESGMTGAYTPTENVTLYALWLPHSYTVAYAANGGTGAPESQTKTQDVVLTLSNAVPTRADEEAGSFTVTFDANGGVVDTSSLTAARTTSFRFASWNTAQDGGGTNYAPGASYMDNTAVTFYARWEETTTTASVTLPTPTREGYDFRGWAFDSSGRLLTGDYIPPSDKALIAVWEANTFTVSYDVNGGEGAPDDQTKRKDVALTLSDAVPTRDTGVLGYTTVTLDAMGGSVEPESLDAERTISFRFLRWNTEQNGSGTGYAPGASYTENADLTLFAQWEETVTISAVQLPTPTREGYAFQGWSETAEADSGFTGSYTPTGDVTLYATWKVLTYTLSFDANGGSNAPGAQEVQRGSALTLTEDEPTRTGFLFLGWAESGEALDAQYQPGDELTPTGDLTLYALWLDLSAPDGVLPASLKRLEDEVLAGCAFRYVKLPDGASAIGSSVFAGSTRLRAVYIPPNVTNIARSAFDGAPEGLTIIGQEGSYAEFFAGKYGFSFVEG